VIGVVADIDADSGDPRDRHFVYVPFESSDVLRPVARVAFLVRAGSDRDAVRAIHTVVERTHPELVVDVLSLREEVARTVPLLRRFSVLLAELGLFGLVIALVGLYGVVAYVAQQRRRELAIRKALGATPMVLWQMISREAVWVLLRGVIPGLFASILMGLALSRYAFGVRPVDATVLAVVACCVFVTAILAFMAPFRRAVHSDPYPELHNL
jgi:predicted lysophospholipase L1 biosynthesis ABC-type transport system permease subunit